jgi:hypothetical protein
MAEEEKVQVDEISNKALNQLKKAFEPTAEEKFEAKRIKAAMASGGGGAGVAGAAAGMFGKKGGGFFKGLGKWLALPVIVMASGIMAMGKGAWNMLTKMIKIIFWPLRWLLGMTGSKEAKALGDVAKKTKGFGLTRMLGMVLRPFIWITSAWAFIEGWLAAPDRNKDGVVSTYEKFLGGLEEVMKWLTLGFVDFSTFEKVKKMWGEFSFKKWVDDMVKVFGDFPDTLATWMNSKTAGLGVFVEKFGKILKEFLFGKEAAGGAAATGGVMGWLAKNLSADKVSGAIIGIGKLAVAFGGMLLTILGNALIGADGLSHKPETWGENSLLGIIHKKIGPQLPTIAKTIAKTILGLFSWIGNIASNLTNFVMDHFIAEGQKEDAGMLSRAIANKLIKVREGKRIKEAENIAEAEAKAAAKAQRQYRIDMEAAHGKGGMAAGDLFNSMYGKGNQYKNDTDRYFGSILMDRFGLGKTDGAMRTGSYYSKPGLQDIAPKFGSFTSGLSEKDITKPSFLTRLLGDAAVVLDFPTKDEEVARKLKESRQGPALFVEKARQLDTKHRDVTERNPLGWGAWFNMSANMKTIANRMSKVYSLKGWGDLALSSGWRKNDPGATQELLTNKAGDLKGLHKKWRTLPGMTDEMLAGGSNSEGRRAAVKLLMKHGFTSSHQHGGGIDFNYPPGFTKARPGNLKQMFESMFPGSYLLPEEDHLHLQLPQPISSGAGALQQGMLLNDAWKSFMSGQPGGGNTIITNNYTDASSNNDSTNVFGSSTEGHTSTAQDKP